MTLSPESSDDLLRQGIAALQMGDRALAASLLARAVRSDPRSERAWLFLAGAVTDPEQRRSCLERVLALNPQNEAARQGLRGLAPAPAIPLPAQAPAGPPPAPARTIPLPPAPARTIPLPAADPPPPRPAPATPEHVMSLLSAAPAEPAPPPPPPTAPVLATSDTMRLSPAMVALDVEPPAAARRPPDRLVWSLILALGLLLMLGSAAYAVILLRG